MDISMVYMLEMLTDGRILFGGWHPAAYNMEKTPQDQIMAATFYDFLTPVQLIGMGASFNNIACAAFRHEFQNLRERWIADKEKERPTPMTPEEQARLAVWANGLGDDIDLSFMEREKNDN